MSKEESVKSGDEAFVHEQAKKRRAVPRWLAGAILWSALGPLSVAYSISIIASSLSQPTFLLAFNAASHSNLTALFSSVGAAPNMGGIFGNVLISWISERHGRKIAMMVAAAISLLGQVLSGGSAHNWGMLIFARVCVGFGGWPLAAVAMTYQSELSITEVRGFLASLVGISIAVGFSSAAWIGYAFFHYHGQQAWRIPMLLGAAIPLLLLLLAPFVPESPRWLCLHGRQEEAKAIVYAIHKSPADPNNVYAEQEFRMISAQAAVDSKLDSSWGNMFRKPSYRRRAWLTILVATAGQCTGIQAVTTFTPQFFATAGYNTNDTLLLSSGWITVAPVMALILQQIIDKVGRRPLIWLSSASAAVVLAILAALSKYYSGSTSTNGKNTLTAFLYIFIVAYMLSETPMYVWFGEAWPMHLRSKGTALAIIIINLQSVWTTYATPYGLQTIKWQYYMMSISVVCAVLLYLYLPETKQLPLERVGEIFGDGDEITAQQAEVSRLSQISSGSHSHNDTVGSEKAASA